jgi:hypothetical protein
LIIATVALALLGGSFWFGYYTGYRQAWHEAFFQPAIVFVPRAEETRKKTGR